jgi:hypothetical protein
MPIPLIFASCSRSLKPDTPVNTMLLLEHSISSDNYDNYSELFGDWCKNKASQADLGEFSKLSAAGFDSSLYGLITYSNGEMLLVKFAPEKVDGEYKVQDVIKVPEDMKGLFK